MYLLRSFADEWNGQGAVDRMTLHPRVSTLNTYKAFMGEAFVVPYRVAYTDAFVDGPWRKSCVGWLNREGCNYPLLPCKCEFGGEVIGNGSDEAALAWLLEGEVRR